MDSHSATTGSDPGATPPNVMTSVSGLPIWRSPSESCSWSSKRAQRETAPEAEEAKNRGKPVVQSRTHMSAVNQVTLRRQCATMHGILPRPPTLAQPVFFTGVRQAPRSGIQWNHARIDQDCASTRIDGNDMSGSDTGTARRGHSREGDVVVRDGRPYLQLGSLGAQPHSSPPYYRP